MTITWHFHVWKFFCCAVESYYNLVTLSVQPGCNDMFTIALSNSSNTTVDINMSFEVGNALETGFGFLMLY